MKAPRETDTVTQCLAYLRLVRQWPCWRANCGGLRRGDRYVAFGEAGQPDVMFLVPPQGGRFGALELKSPRGRLRPEQRAWLESAGRAGALVIVTTSLDGLRQALEDAGLPE
jgi:hypothetical protein